MTGFDPAEHLGEQVTVRGTAYNAAAGAIVSLDGAPLYIDGLDEWDPELYGRPVEATGRLVRRPGTKPERRVGEGSVHGVGETYALEDASWSRR